MNCEIIAIGSELLTPHRSDTNSLFLTERLNKIGVQVTFKSVVGDRQQDLVDQVRIALNRVDIVITMGGLGPTVDDLTREAVAEALGFRLKRDQAVVGALYARFAAHRMTMTENNSRQGDIIDGAVVLENSNGTAPGQWLDIVYNNHRKLLILLPGPPSEIKPLFDAQCLPRLTETLPKHHIATRTLKATMIAESLVDSRIAPIYSRYADVETTILSDKGDIQLNLICGKPLIELAQARVDELASRIEDELGDLIYSSQGESLEQIVLYYLEMRGATLATAESCTGGMMAQRLTSISGSSRSYIGGAVVYSNELKTEFAGVPPSMLNEHGAVSREVAAALAEGIRQRCSSTIGVGITGVAGPSGGSEEKPVGLVYIATADEKSTEVVEKRFGRDRERIRQWSTQQALDLVRRRLM